MEASGTSPSTRDSIIYTPLLVVSELSLIVTVPLVAVVVLVAIVTNGYGGDNGQGAPGEADVIFGVGIVVVTVLWLAAVFKILARRNDGPSKRAKAAGVVTTMVTFYLTIALGFLFAFDGLRGVMVLLVLGSPVLSALAGSVVTGCGWIE